MGCPSTTPTIADLYIAFTNRMQDEVGVKFQTTRTSRTTDITVGLAKEIALCNAFAPDVAVEVHNNAGGGKDFKIYHQTSTYKLRSLALAQALEAQVKATGQTTRGCKTLLSGTVDYYGWLCQVNCPAVLCEGAFLDNLQDVARIDTEVKHRVFGVAYAKGGGVPEYCTEAPQHHPVRRGMAGDCSVRQSSSGAVRQCYKQGRSGGILQSD